MKNGRVDHGNGMHDDLVIALLLTYWFITRTRNLHNYGINTRDILSGNREVNSNESVAQRAFNAVQERLKHQLEVLSTQLKKERDNNIKFVLERQIRNVASLIRSETGEVFSIDDYLRQIKEESDRETSFQRSNYSTYNFRY